RDFHVTGVQTCALPISPHPRAPDRAPRPLPGSPISTATSREAAVQPRRFGGRLGGSGLRAATLRRAIGGSGLRAATPGRFAVTKIGRAPCRESVKILYV